jgi:lipoprotein signal peptidase
MMLHLKSLILVALLLLLDQGSKFASRLIFLQVDNSDNSREYRATQQEIILLQSKGERSSGFAIAFTYVRNFGSFLHQDRSPSGPSGYLPQLRIFLGASLVVLLYLWRQRIPMSERRYRSALGLGIAGALGNTLDRLGWRYVVDFLQLRLQFSGLGNQPRFFVTNANLADLYLLVGVILLLIVAMQGSLFRSQEGKV